MPYNTPEKSDLKYQPSKKMIIINSHHGIIIRKSVNPLIDLDVIKNMKSNRADRLSARKLTKSSIYFPASKLISGKLIISIIAAKKAVCTSPSVIYFVYVLAACLTVTSELINQEMTAAHVEKQEAASLMASYSMVFI